MTKASMPIRRGPGRPRKDEGSRPTSQVRIAADLTEILSALAWMGTLPNSTAVVLDPLIRPWIEAEFAKLPAGVRDVVNKRIAALTAA